VLHPVQKGGETAWVHEFLGFDEDHPAVPVEQDEIHTQYRCDFCNVDDPTFKLPTTSFDAGQFELPFGITDVASGQNFLACEPCAQLIDKNQWSSLLMRVTKSWEDRHGNPMPDVAKTALSRYYRKLRRNITGSLKYFDPKEGL
jgi:hypothetical protein